MQLLLLRHGIAEDHGPDGTDDARRLTDKGIAKTTAVVAGLVRVVDCPDAIFTSPKVRARQTADIVARAFDIPPQVAAVLGDNDADAICDWLQRIDHDTVMLVGHEPSFSGIIEKLCTGSLGDFIEMKKAGCACLEVDVAARSAVLQWLAPAKLLVAMGDA
jgi:phosphohistidine phosphatase